MVIHSLPKKLVKRVKLIAKRKAPSQLEKLALRLKNMDHRNLDLKELSLASNKSELNVPGGRVRKLGVNRNYPGIKEVILKKVHGSNVGEGNALETIRYLRKLVNTHNKVFGQNYYYLDKPIAYHVGKQFVLMAKADKFSVDQLLRQPPSEKFESYTHLSPPSPGKFLSEISLHTKKPVSELRVQLDRSISLLNKRTQLGRENFLVVGYKEGKFIFVPLIDLF